MLLRNTFIIDAPIVEAVLAKRPTALAISNPTPRKLSIGISATEEPTPPMEKRVETAKVIPK